MSDWIKNLPAPVRHFLAIFAAAALAVIVKDVSAAGGLSGLDWAATGRAALDAGVVALVGVGVLAGTPLTVSYGVSKSVESAEILPNIAGDPDGVVRDPALDVELDEVEEAV